MSIVLILGLLKISRFKTIVIVHDVKSFDIKETDRLWKLQYNLLSGQLIVHNQYSYDVFHKTVSFLKTPIKITAYGGHLDVIRSLGKRKARAELGFSSNIKYLLFFGLIKKSKGLDVLLEAMPKCNNIRLIIAGKTWRDDFTDYQEIIGRRGLQDNISLDIRYIEDDEKDLFFNAVDYVVLPHKEIYQSGVLLMYMSFGRPVIASDLPATQDIVIIGKNGLLFKKERPKDLERVLVKAISSDAESLEKKPLKTIKSEFDWNQIVLEYLPLLK